MSEWQPIKTAPKETVLILYYPPIDHPIQGRTHRAWIKVDYPSFAGARNPTHWMHLPAPPKEPERE